MVEYWSGGILEWWNGGTIDNRNPGQPDSMKIGSNNLPNPPIIPTHRLAFPPFHHSIILRMLDSTKDEYFEAN